MSRPRGVRTGAEMPASKTMLLKDLIRSSVDEASYERADRTNRLWLIKRPGAASDAPQRQSSGHDAHTSAPSL